MRSSWRRSSSLLPPSLVFKLPALVLVLIYSSGVARGANNYPELPRFHQINERLSRGAQPREGGVRRLAELGVNTIINLRGTSARTRTDEMEARALGLKYFNVPLPVWGRPDDKGVRRVMEILAEPESGKVFVHCKDGVDRTGLIVALHRISQDGWHADEASAEALRYGMRRYQYWKRDYINDYYVRRQRTAGGQVQSEDDWEGEINDRIGAGVRVGERAVLSVGKTTVRVVRRAPRTMNRFFGKIF